MGGILSFAAVAAVVIATPGPDTALTIRNTLLHGRGGGVATALGVASAHLGLSALRDAWTGGGAPHPVASAGGASGRAAAFRQGLVSNLGNPKMAVFFTSLLNAVTGAALVAVGVRLALERR